MAGRNSWSATWTARCADGIYVLSADSLLFLLSFCCTQPFSLSASFGIGRLSHGNGGREQSRRAADGTEKRHKNDMAEGAARLVENPLAAIRLRQPIHKKVPELNSCFLYPESGTFQSSLVCCRILILLPSSLRTSASYPHCTEDTKHVSCLPPQRICQPYPHVIRQANDCLPESCSRTSACDRIAPIGNTNVF